MGVGQRDGEGKGVLYFGIFSFLISFLLSFPYRLKLNDKKEKKSGTQKKGWNFLDGLFVSFFADLIKTTGGKKERKKS